MFFLFVILLIAAMIAPVKWAVSLARRRLSRNVVLYQFRDSSYRRRIKQAWHVVGERKAVEAFISDRELTGFVRVSWIGANGQIYIGTYKKRLVSKFRRTLRERGAKVEVQYEMPPFLSMGFKKYHFVTVGK